MVRQGSVLYVGTATVPQVPRPVFGRLPGLATSYCSSQKNSGAANRSRPYQISWLLQDLNVLCLPAFGAFLDFELHGLAFLQATESIRLDRREMHENIFAGLTADKAKTLGVVKPLYCSLFHVVTFSVLNFSAEKIAAGESGIAGWRADNHRRGDTTWPSF